MAAASSSSALAAEEEPASRWLPSKGLAGGRRVALLVGVGKYARHPAWDLPWVSSDLEVLERSLRANANFHEVSKLEDGEVSKAALETRLEKLAAFLSGEGNVLLVFWSGHGCLDATGEPRYLLSDADDLPGGEFRNTLGESDLAELLAPLRRSGKARTVFVADACRVPVMAPARSGPRFVTAADAAVYSTRRGQFASVEPGAKRSAFVESLERALSRLSAKPSLSLGELVEWVRSDMAERGLKQAPELAGEESAAALALFDRANLSFGVRVLHALSREELRGALVKIPGLGRKGESPAVFRGLAPGSYRIEISREGFFRELVELALDEKGSGGTLEVSLSPEYVELEGSVSDEAQKPLAGIRCSLAGSYGDFLRGYHTWEATTDAGGRFVFRIPPRAAVHAVLASGGPKGRRELPLDLSKLSPRESVVRGRILRAYAVGRVVVPSDEVVKVEELGLRGRETARWKAAEEVLEKALAGSASHEDLDIAIACYGNLVPLVAEGARAAVKGRLRLAGDYERAAACLEDLRRLAPEDPLVPIMEKKLAPHVDAEPPSVKLVYLKGALGAEEIRGPRVEAAEAGKTTRSSAGRPASGYPPRRSVSTRAGRATQARTRRGASSTTSPGTRGPRAERPTPWARSGRTASGSTTCAATSGRKTGSVLSLTRIIFHSEDS